MHFQLHVRGAVVQNQLHHGTNKMSESGNLINNPKQTVIKSTILNHQSSFTTPKQLEKQFKGHSTVDERLFTFYHLKI